MSNNIKGVTQGHTSNSHKRESLLSGFYSDMFDYVSLVVLVYLIIVFSF